MALLPMLWAVIFQQQAFINPAWTKIFNLVLRVRSWDSSNATSISISGPCTTSDLSFVAASSKVRRSAWLPV